MILRIKESNNEYELIYITGHFLLYIYIYIYIIYNIYVYVYIYVYIYIHINKLLSTYITTVVQNTWDLTQNILSFNLRYFKHIFLRVSDKTLNITLKTIYCTKKCPKKKIYRKFLDNASEKFHYFNNINI